jgi:hypothetical protein
MLKRSRRLSESSNKTSGTGNPGAERRIIGTDDDVIVLPVRRFLGVGRRNLDDYTQDHTWKRWAQNTG